jgi:hypothetical protein
LLKVNPSTLFLAKKMIPKGAIICKEIMQRRYNAMAVHHGGKVGNAAKTLAKKNSSKSSKSKAGTILADHKAKKHK